MADDRELRLKVKVDDEASKPLHSIGDSADDTTKNLDGMNRGLKKLDAQAEITKKAIKDLRQEISKTGDLDLVKDVAKQEKQLRDLARTRKSLVGDGEKEAQGFAAKFSQKLGPLLASAPVSPPMLAAFAGAAPGIIPIVSAAVTAGVGLATVGAGLKIAFSDPAVQAAGKDLGAEITASLKDSAKPFVGETLRAINIVRGEFRSLKPEIDDLFADSARYVQPLTRSATGFVRQLLPGLKEANRNAEPLIETLGEHGPQAGAAFGSMLKDLSQNADVTAASLDGLLTSVEQTLVTTGKLAGFVNKVYPYLGPGLLPWIGAMDDGKQATENAVGPTMDLTEEMKKEATSAHTAAVKVESLADAVHRMNGENASAMEASIGLEQAIDDATAAAKENGRTTDINTAKGRANKSALIGIATAANQAYEATLTQTGSQEQANAAMTRGRTKFLEAAHAMGVGKTEAEKLANQLFGIPKNTTANVNVNTKQATAAVKALKARIAEISRRIDIKAVMTTSYGGGAHTGQGYSTGYSAGGEVHGPGPKGVDSVAARLAPGEHVWTAAEVDAAGGQAAVERLRRQIRSGRRPEATAGGATSTSGGPQQVVVRFDTSGSDRSILSAFLKAIRDAGGNPGVLGV